MSQYTLPTRTKHVLYACLALLEFGAHDVHSSRNKRDAQVKFLLTELYKDLCSGDGETVFHGIIGGGDAPLPAPPQVSSIFSDVLEKG